MSWLYTYRRSWRAAGLIAILVGLLGPWGFDKTHVPLPFECSPPSIRLHGEFCGSPISIATNFPYILRDFFNLVSRLVSGEANLLEPLFFLLMFLLILPLLSSMILIGWKDRRGWQLAHLAILGIAEAGSIWMVSQNLMMFSSLIDSTNPWTVINIFARQLFALWGIWLYIGATDVLILCEVLALTGDK